MDDEHQIPFYFEVFIKTYPIVQSNVSTSTDGNSHHTSAGNLNVKNIKNVSISDVPPLTLSDSKEKVHFSIEDSDAPMRNSAPYNATITTPITEKYTKDHIPAGKATVKDGAFSLGINRFRHADGQPTKTQQILSEKSAALTKLISCDEKVELCKEDRLRMVNDPVRRAFESYYAKIALEKAFNDPKTLQFYSKFSNDQLEYIKKNFLTSDVQKSFENAKKGISFEFDSQLGGFYTRIEKAVNTLDIPTTAKEKVFEIYLNRYINLALRNDPNVTAKLPQDHWDKVFDAFKAPGKGRVEIKVDEGDMFRQTDSHALGLLRSFDPAPRDLTMAHEIKYDDNYQGKLTAGKSTRCPDRLEIQDPLHPDAFKENAYVKGLYEEGIGTYINGPSGTILIEQGAMRACKDIHQDKSSEELGKFLELHGLMFIYLDGGHSMHEISYALNTDDVKDKMIAIFPDKMDIGEIGKMLFRDSDVLKQAAKATEPFSQNLLNKDLMHQELKARK